MFKKSSIKKGHFGTSQQHPTQKNQRMYHRARVLSKEKEEKYRQLSETFLEILMNMNRVHCSHERK